MNDRPSTNQIDPHEPIPSSGEAHLRQQLQKSQELLAHAERLSQTGAAEWDPLMDRWQFSDGWLAIHGCRRREMSTEELLPIAHPDDRPAIQKALDRVRQGLGAYDIQHRIIRQDTGEVRLVQAYAEAERDDQGRVVRVVGAVQDITDRRSAEQSLRQSEERYRLLADYADDFVLLFDIAGGRLYVSPSYYRRTGWTAEEIQSTDWRTRVHPDELAMVERTRAANLAGQPTTIEHRTLCRDGAWIWVEAHCRPITDAQGRVVQMVLWSREITERKLAEEAMRKLNEELEERVRKRTAELQSANEALRESEARFRDVLEQSLDGIYRRNLKTDRLDYLSPALAQILRYPLERLLGLSSSEGLALVHPDDVATVRNRISQASGMTSVVQYRVKCGDGQYRWLAEHRIVLVDADGHPHYRVGVVRDFTDQKAAEERERIQRAEIAHLSRLGVAGQMAAGIAHELNQPLGAILNYAGVCLELLRRGTGEPQTLADVIQSIAREGKRAGDIIRNLRSFVRRQEPHRALVNLNEVVSEAVSLLEWETLHRGISIRLELEDSLPELPLDRVQIVQVLVNLMTNAMDAMNEPGAIGRELVIRTFHADSGGQVGVRVIDLGCGMTPQTLSRAFDEFFTTKSDGLGLGLPIGRSIIESHGGSLTACVNPRGGTTFEFVLPSV